MKLRFSFRPVDAVFLYLFADLALEDSPLWWLAVALIVVSWFFDTKDRSITLFRWAGDKTEDADPISLIAKHLISINFDEQKPNLRQPFEMRYVNCIAHRRASGVRLHLGDSGVAEPLGSDPESAVRRAVIRAALAPKQ